MESVRICDKTYMSLCVYFGFDLVSSVLLLNISIIGLPIAYRHLIM